MANQYFKLELRVPFMVHGGVLFNLVLQFFNFLKKAPLRVDNGVLFQLYSLILTS